MSVGWAGYRPLAPPASEPISIDLARQHCRIDADYDDNLLAMYVTSARIRAEEYLQRALFTQKWRYNITWGPPPTATPLVPQSLIVFPLNWPPLVRRPIELLYAPTQSVDQIMWGALGELTLADPDDYDVNLGVDPGYVAVKPQLLPRIPQQTMQIDYTCGYHDSDPNAVPMPIRHAILVGTAHYYENRGDVAANMPAAFFRLLDPFRLWTFAG